MPNFTHYFIEFINPDFIFWFSALAGSGMVLIQFVINLFGVAAPESCDATTSLSENATQADCDAADVRKFQWLSLQTIAGFMMMFGWSAITCQKEFALSGAIATTISVVIGLLTAFIMRSVFKLAKKLRSPGSVYRIEDAIGKQAYVYQRIPRGGRGKISLSLNNFTHEIDALSHHPEELSSFTRVIIIEKRDDSTVVVAPL